MPTPRHRAPVIVALLGLLGLLGCSESPPSIQPPAPDTGSMQSRVATAIDQARATLIEQPSAIAWGELGAVCDVHELLECAETSYRQAADLEPGTFRWIYLLALVRERRGASVDEVLSLLAEAALLDPSFAPREVRVGDVAMRAGRLEDAHGAYQRAALLDERLAAARLGLAQVLVDLDRPTEALAALDEAVRLGGRGRRVLSLRARALSRLDRVDESAAAAAAAREAQPLIALVDPHRAWVDSHGTGPAQCYARARRLMSDRRWAEALEQLEIVVESRPNFASLQHRIGICHARLGRLDEALEHLQRALELKPELTDARGMRGALLLQSGRFEAAAEELSRVCDESPADSSAVAGLASALIQLGRETDALSALERGATHAPLDANGEFLLGTLLLRRGDPNAAEAHCRTAIRIDPTHAAAHRRLAEALLAQGRDAEAAAARRAAEGLSPRGAKNP